MDTQCQGSEGLSIQNWILFADSDKDGQKVLLLQKCARLTESEPNTTYMEQRKYMARNDKA